jgi:hypothetical protein
MNRLKGPTSEDDELDRRLHPLLRREEMSEIKNN